MRAFTIDQYGENSPLRMTNQPLPEIGEHDVLVEIHAASLNPIDYKIQEGKMKFLLPYRFPLILGNDFSGVVVKVGSKVTALGPGDEVFGRPRKSRIGTFAEYIAVNEEEVAVKPVNLSFVEAATIPLVGLTTLQAFTEKLELEKGQKILIHAGAGGVGTFAIQLAKVMGAYVATTVSESGYELVKSLGADRIINYRKDDFADLLRDYDAVYDTLGGAVLERSFQVLKPFGRIVSVAGVPNASFGREYGLAWWKNLLLAFAARKITALETKFQAGYSFLFMKPSGNQLSYLGNLMELNQIRPVIDRVYDFQQTEEALAYLKTGRAKGKVAVKMK